MIDGFHISITFPQPRFFLCSAYDADTGKASWSVETMLADAEGLVWRTEEDLFASNANHAHTKYGSKDEHLLHGFWPWGYSSVFSFFIIVGMNLLANLPSPLFLRYMNPMIEKTVAPTNVTKRSFMVSIRPISR